MLEKERTTSVVRGGDMLASFTQGKCGTGGSDTQNGLDRVDVIKFELAGSGLADADRITDHANGA